MTARQPTVGVGAITIACNILEGIPTNAELESLLLEYGLSEAVPGRGSISKTMLELKKFAATHPDHVVHTGYGERTLSVVVVEEAIRRFGRRLGHNVEMWDRLERYLNLDGYALLKEAGHDWDGEYQEITGIGLAMPEFAGLPESSSEVDTLLARYGLSVAGVHLDSAKKNIAQGNWEAANSQCRAFLEALTDGIADRLYPAESATRRGGLQKRQLLAEKGFLSGEKHEFSGGNGHAFLPGLAKLLHSDGASRHFYSARCLVSVADRGGHRALAAQADRADFVAPCSGEPIAQVEGSHEVSGRVHGLNPGRLLHLPMDSTCKPDRCGRVRLLGVEGR